MKKSRYTESQIVMILKEVEAGPLTFKAHYKKNQEEIDLVSFSSPEFS